MTRGDIEEVRGVSVSPNIMRTLLERGWIRSVGQREVPGRPALYGTTNSFLDYFDLANLDELPPLAEIRALITPAEDDDGEDAALSMTEEIAEDLGATVETDPGDDGDSGLENVVPLPTVDR